jgi:hypothetical protein
MQLGQRLGSAAVILAGLFEIGCAGTTINRILAEPDRYRHREVQLKGDVVRSVSALGRGAYKLDDGTGTIVVVSERGVPRRGAEVKVRGKIVDVVDVGGLVRLPPEIDRELGSGLLMIEREHRAR